LVLAAVSELKDDCLAPSKEMALFMNTGKVPGKIQKVDLDSGVPIVDANGDPVWCTPEELLIQYQRWGRYLHSAGAVLKKEIKDAKDQKSEDLAKKKTEFVQSRENLLKSYDAALDLDPNLSEYLKQEVLRFTVFDENEEDAAGLLGFGTLPLARTPGNKHLFPQFVRPGR